MSTAATGTRHWWISLALVLLLHALLAVAAIWWSARKAPPVASAPAAAVMLELAPLPQAPPAPPRAQPPGPPQQAQRQQREPAPKPPLPPLPTRTGGELPPPQTVQPSVEQPEADRDVDRTQAPPDVAAPPSTRYAAQQNTAGERSTVAATWQAQLLGHLQQHRRYPRQAERLRQQGVSYVRFAVARDGRVSAIALGRSSGFALLDAETLATVQRASPVPPPPVEVQGDPVEVMVPVAFFIRGR